MVVDFKTEKRTVCQNPLVYSSSNKQYDYRNRVYSENLGRFLQTDPILFEAGDVNIYRYCGNDVINKIDPDGLDSKKEKKDPIERDGILALDTDGTGDDHNDPYHQNETSYKNPDGSSLNADKDSYGVAPKDLARTPKNPDGPLVPGDKMTVKFPDGKQINTRIGDFGPKGKNGEVSLKAAKDAGVPVKQTPQGPVPAGKDIPVKVTYYPGTSKTK